MDRSRMLSNLSRTVDVLVVDATRIRPRFGLAAEARGATWAHARTVAEARDRLSASPPRVLATALDLPDRSGLELLGWIDALQLDTVVLMSGSSPQVDPPDGDLPGRVALIRDDASARDRTQLLTKHLAAARRPSARPRLTFSDYLAVALVARSAVELRFRRVDGCPVTVEIADGEILDISVDSIRGEAALRSLAANGIVRSLEAHRLTEVRTGNRPPIPGPTARAFFGARKGHRP